MIEPSPSTGRNVIYKRRLSDIIYSHVKLRIFIL
jgi:hypothetical protein